jgi:uncharacterized protein (DUF934 family)
MQIIKHKAVRKDDWIVLRLAESDTAQSVAVPDGKVIVPLAVWQAQQDALRSRAALGVWLASHEHPEVLQNDLTKFAVIAVDFPRFADGRGYTIAHLLRTRMHYKGELRAIGNVLRDQLFYMQRVGFDAFAMQHGKDLHAALQSLNDFSVTYQASSDQPQPLFRRVQRERAA